MAFALTSIPCLDKLGHHFEMLPQLPHWFVLHSYLEPLQKGSVLNILLIFPIFGFSVTLPPFPLGRLDPERALSCLLLLLELLSFNDRCAANHLKNNYKD